MCDLCDNYLTGGAKSIAVYNTAINCLTLANEQHKNNYYILKL